MEGQNTAPNLQPLPPTTDPKDEESGCYSSPPPCVDPNEKCGPKCNCRSYCETSFFCRRLGSVGIPEEKLEKWGLQRHRLMLTCAVMSFIGWVLCIPPAWGVSTDKTATHDVPWAIATPKNSDDDGSKSTMYIGLASAVVYDKNDDFVDQFVFGKDDCGNDDGFGFGGLKKSECNACANAASGLQASAIISVITQLTQLLTDLQRSTKRGDVNCQKFMGIFTGVLGLVMGIYSLAEFRRSCWGNVGYRHVDWKTNSGVDIETGPGAGWILTWFAVIFKLIDIAA